MQIYEIDTPADIPVWTSQEAIARFLHVTMQPYEDSLVDIERGLKDALSAEPGKNGFYTLQRFQ